MAFLFSKCSTWQQTIAESGTFLPEHGIDSLRVTHRNGDAPWLVVFNPADVAVVKTGNPKKATEETDMPKTQTMTASQPGPGSVHVPTAMGGNKKPRAKRALNVHFMKRMLVSMMERYTDEELAQMRKQAACHAGGVTKAENAKLACMQHELYKEEGEDPDEDEPGEDEPDEDEPDEDEPDEDEEPDAQQFAAVDNFQSWQRTHKMPTRRPSQDVLRDHFGADANREKAQTALDAMDYGALSKLGKALDIKPNGKTASEKTESLRNLIRHRMGSVFKRVERLGDGQKHDPIQDEKTTSALLSLAAMQEKQGDLFEREGNTADAKKVRDDAQKLREKAREIIQRNVSTGGSGENCGIGKDGFQPGNTCAAKKANEGKAGVAMAERLTPKHIAYYKPVGPLLDAARKAEGHATALLAEGDEDTAHAHSTAAETLRSAANKAAAYLSSANYRKGLADTLKQSGHAQEAAAQSKIAQEWGNKANKVIHQALSAHQASGDNCGIGKNGFQPGNTCAAKKATEPAVDDIPSIFKSARKLQKELLRLAQTHEMYVARIGDWRSQQSKDHEAWAWDSRVKAAALLKQTKERVLAATPEADKERVTAVFNDMLKKQKELLRTAAEHRLLAAKSGDRNPSSTAQHKQWELDARKKAAALLTETEAKLSGDTTSTSGSGENCGIGKDGFQPGNTCAAKKAAEEGTLSQLLASGELDAEEAAYLLCEMGDDDDEAAPVSLTTRLREVETAFRQWATVDNVKPNQWPDTNYWCREVFKHHVIAESAADGDLYQIPYTSTGAGTSGYTFGRPVKVTTQYVPMAATEISSLCAADNGWRLFVEHEFGEAPEWMPLLPKPGKYQHPKYGQIHLSKERNASFASGVNNKIYQSSLPINTEHAPSNEGAHGWIEEARLNEDGSVDARVTWTDLGKDALAKDRFRFISPEWQDECDAPDGRKLKNVIRGAALTVRPFFKDKHLRPLVANENGWQVLQDLPKADSEQQFYLFTALQPTAPARTPGTNPTRKEPKIMADEHNDTELIDMREGETLVDIKEFSELKQRQLTLEAENKEFREKAEAAAAELKKLTEANAKLADEAQTKRFTEEVNGTSTDNKLAYVGDFAAHVKHLKSMAQAFGEDSEEVKHYMNTQRQAAALASQSLLFREVGKGAVESETSAYGKLTALAKEFQAKNPSKSFEQSFAEVMAMPEHKELYQRYNEEGN